MSNFIFIFKNKLKFGIFPRNYQEGFEGLFPTQIIHNSQSYFCHSKWTVCKYFSTRSQKYFITKMRNKKYIQLIYSSLKKGSFKFCLALLHMEMSVLHWDYETACMNSPRTVTTCKECKFCGSAPEISIYSLKSFSPQELHSVWINP